MKVLLWGQPWHSQGGLAFHRNSLIMNLMAQGAVLAKAGFTVTLVTSDALLRSLHTIPDSFNVVKLPFDELHTALSGFCDPSRELYEKGRNAKSSCAIAEYLSRKLPDDYDIILVWEAPIPFFRELYPNATIISEMPGAFCRPPYPQFTVFDPVGLFRESCLYQFSSAIMKSTPSPTVMDFVGQFRSKVCDHLRGTAIFSREQLDPMKRYKKLWLLPLQVTAHYAFTVDTGFDSQIDFLLTALRDIPPSDAFVATQYVNKMMRDVVLTPETLDILRDRPIIFNTEFDCIPTISQFLLPSVDGVVTASSSLGLQALAWNIPVKVYGDTFLTPYDTSVDGRSESDVAEKLLPFILNRHQVLTERLLDKDFLIPLIEDIHSRQKRNGLDKLPDYLAIDSDYAGKVLHSFRFGKIPKIVRARVKAEEENISGFSSIINEPKTQLISFDLFDTLIQRPFAKPSDLYLELGRVARERLDAELPNFATVRLECEQMARDASVGREISLADIHRRLVDHYGLTLQQADELFRLELETELRFVKPKTSGLLLWNAAKASGRSRIIVSDMYLPEDTIAAMADKCGFGDYDRLFVSSSFGVTKKSGQLFDIVIEEMRVPPQAVIHIGDNAEGDVLKPREKGIVCRRVPSNMECLRSHHGLSFMSQSQPFHFGDLFSSIASALTAERFFDGFQTASGMDLFRGDTRNIGYIGLGPVLLGYVLWLRKQAKTDNLEKLYFLSREGKILHQIFTAIDSVDPSGISAQYLYCSRRTLAVASLKTSVDIRLLASARYSHDAKIGDLLEGRFGIDTGKISKKDLLRFGYPSLKTRIGESALEKRRFVAFCESLTDRIITETKPERDDYVNYLREMGLFDEDTRFAIVDIGWEGNIQALLSRVLERALNGYYYAMMAAAERLRHEGQQYACYMDEGILLPHPSALVSNKAVSEFLICESKPTIVKVIRNTRDGGFTPVVAEERDNGARRRLIEAVHEGIMHFVGDVIGVMDDGIASLSVSPFHAEKVMQRFFSTPTYMDVSLLSDAVIHDKFTGTTERKLLSKAGWSIGKAATQRKQMPFNKKHNKGYMKNRWLNWLGLSVEHRLMTIHHALHPVRLQEYISNRENFFLSSCNRYAIIWWNVIGCRLDDRRNDADRG